MFSQFKIYFILAAAIGLFGAGFLGGYKIESASKEALIAKYEAAQKKVLEDYIKDRDVKEAKANEISKDTQLKLQQIANQKQARLNDIQKYISDTCITYGAIRLHDSFILNKSPTELPLPTGKLDSACSGLTARQVMAVILRNYEIAKSNAVQLNALIDAVKATR